jgi:hypothetical protein
MVDVLLVVIGQRRFSAGGADAPAATATDFVGTTRPLLFWFRCAGQHTWNRWPDSHYLPLGGSFVLYLYGPDVPAWLPKLRTDAHVVRRSDALFEGDTIGVEDSEFSLSKGSDAELALSPWLWPIKVSSAERAILEAIDELPKSESFHTIDAVF